ncbi:hypothetical protein [Methylobacterium terricola]|uniref:hypothetical protein n=1 Tax=Methylobacterium terricola TaxID=2583531 RepID=UPI00197B7D65|nr:hypothetical protein [Methylobacterium terricola]
MTEPTVPASIVLSPDHPAIPSAPDLRAIDLASAAAGPECLDDGTRAELAQAGQEALEACLRRLAPAERAAFWLAIGRCYNRPYNPPETASAEAAGIPTDGLPPAHVIDAVHPRPDSARPEAVLR